MQIAPPSFNAVDWTVVVLLLVGLISGFRRGLSGELATVAATVISGIAAWKLSGWAQGLLLQNLDLTPREAAKLQGVPEYVFAKAGVSDKAAYKQLGNAVNVGVVRLVTHALMTGEVPTAGTARDALPLFSR